MCSISLASSANNIYGKGIINNNVQVKKPTAENLHIQYYFYRYKLPLSKINHILADFKLSTVYEHTIYPYVNKISATNIDIINQSFSQNFTPINSGKTWCIINGLPGMVSGSAVTDSGEQIEATISFSAHKANNNKTTVVLNTVDSKASVNAMKKTTAQIDDMISGNIYIILSQQKQGDLFVGQVILVKFDK